MVCAAPPKGKTRQSVAVDGTSTAEVLLGFCCSCSQSQVHAPSVLSTDAPNPCHAQLNEARQKANRSLESPGAALTIPLIMLHGYAWLPEPMRFPGHAWRRLFT